MRDLTDWMERRNRPFDLIRKMRPQPVRTTWYTRLGGYALLTPTDGRFGHVKYITNGPHKGRFWVYASDYDESSDPEGRFILSGYRGHKYRLTLSNKSAVECALSVLRTSYSRTMNRLNKTEKERVPVVVRLKAGIPRLGPHGIVHDAVAKCRNSRNPRPEWGRAENVHAADREYPDHELFWCAQCFGLANPRRTPKGLRFKWVE